MAEAYRRIGAEGKIYLSQPATIIPGRLYGINGDNPGPDHRDAYATMIIGRDMNLITDVGSGVNHERLIARVNEVQEMTGGRKKTALIVTHRHADHANDASRCYEEGIVDEIWAGIPDITVEPTGDPTCMDTYDDNKRMADYPIHRRLQDGEELDLGGGVIIEVVSLPGHAPDLIGLFLDDAAIVSDLAGGISPLIGSDTEMQHHSLRKFKSQARSKGIQRVIEGHVNIISPTVTIDEYEAMTRNHGRPRSISWAHLYNPLD